MNKGVDNSAFKNKSDIHVSKLDVVFFLKLIDIMNFNNLNHKTTFHFCLCNVIFYQKTRPKVFEWLSHSVRKCVSKIFILLSILLSIVLLSKTNKSYPKYPLSFTLDLKNKKWDASDFFTLYTIILVSNLYFNGIYIQYMYCQNCVKRNVISL